MAANCSINYHYQKRGFMNIDLRRPMADGAASNKISTWNF